MNRMIISLLTFVMTIPSALWGAEPPAVMTVRLQSALDSVGAIPGGGRLVLGPGTYVSGSLRIPSDVELRLERGAVLLGSTNPFDYEGYARPEDEPNLMADKCSRRLFAFISADGARNVRITGQGTIDGRGLEVALAIDSLHHTGVRVDPGYNTRRMRPSIRPKLMEFDGVDGLEIDSVNLRGSASWGLSLNKCANVVIKDIDFENRAYWNNDGIDIADCRHVLVCGCRINSADDGIVLKSFDPQSENYDITITGCHITSSANALKMGTESFGGFRKVRISDIKVTDTFRSAVALESVDGARLEDVVVDGVDAINTGNAIFVRLGHRRGEKPGSLSDVVIRNLTCAIPFGRPDEAYDLRGPDINTIHNPFPNSITGLPDAKVKNITLENITITHPGRGTKGMAYVGLYRADSVPEMRDAYPEFHMFGELPAWGFFLRHIDGLTVRNVALRLAAPDYRPPVVALDVANQSGQPVVLR